MEAAMSLDAIKKNTNGNCYFSYKLYKFNTLILISIDQNVMSTTQMESCMSMVVTCWKLTKLGNEQTVHRPQSDYQCRDVSRENLPDSGRLQTKVTVPQYHWMFRAISRHDEQVWQLTKIMKYHVAFLQIH